MKLNGVIYRDALNTCVFVDTSKIYFSRVNGRAYYHRYIWMSVSEQWIALGREYVTSFALFRKSFPTYKATIEV